MHPCSAALCITSFFHFGSTNPALNSTEQCEQDVRKGHLCTTHLVVVAAAESARSGSASRLARDEDEGSRVAGGGPRAGRGTRGAGEGRLAVRRPDGVKLSLLGLQED